MAIGTIVNGDSGSSARTKINAAFAFLDAGAVTNPHVLYVRTDGNDTTGNGTPALPYLTAQKAYDTGVAAAVAFVIDMGVGSFSVALAADWSSLCQSVRGAGYGLASTTSPTQLTVTATGAAGSGSDGAVGFNVTVQAINLYLAVNTTGGTADDTFTGGVAGNITVYGGSACVSLTAAGGQGGILVGNGGNGGVITLSGPLIFASDGWLSVDIGQAGAGGGLAGSAGSVVADGCDVRPGFFGPSSGMAATLGRCSYPTAAGLTLTDKGGNSAN